MTISITQPDMLSKIRSYLLSISDITDIVGQRIFTHTIPKAYAGTDCIVLEQLPSLGSDEYSPITQLSFGIKCFSLTKSTALDIERTAIFPNFQGYSNFETEGYWWTVSQSSSSFLVQDPDYIKEYWFSDSEYQITLRY